MDGPQAGQQHRLPSKSLLTALEAFNWIAFRQPVDADLTGYAGFRTRWGSDPTPNAVERLALALEELETGAENEELSAAAWASHARRHARRHARMLAERLPSALHLTLQIHAAEYWRLKDALNRAVAEVIDRAAGGVLQVLASPALPADPSVGRYSPAPSGPAAPLDPCLFATEGLLIQPWGRIEVPGHAGYLNARLRTPRCCGALARANGRHTRHAHQSDRCRRGDRIRLHRCGFR